MKEIENKLIVFTRYPEAGKTKTRLIESLGPDGAADLQREMTEAVLVNARSLQERGKCEIEVCFPKTPKPQIFDKYYNLILKMMLKLI